MGQYVYQESKRFPGKVQQACAGKSLSQEGKRVGKGNELANHQSPLGIPLTGAVDAIEISITYLACLLIKHIASYQQ